MAENRKFNDNDLKKLFDTFNNTITNGFISERALKKLSASPNWDQNLAYKIKIMKQMNSYIQTMLNIKLAKLGERFSVRQTLSFFAHPDMSNVCFQQQVIETGNSNIVPIKICIPLDKLIQMPAMEIYAIISTATYSAVKASKGTGTTKLSHLDLDKVSEGKDGAVKDKLEKRAEFIQHREKAELLLSKYLEGFLSKHFSGDFKEFDDISKVIAADVLRDLSPEEIEKMMSSFFDFSKYDDNAVEKLADFTGKPLNELMGELRKDKLFYNAQQLWKDPDKQPEAISATNQYRALMSDELKGKFANILKEQEANGFGKDSSLASFCKEFATTFMASNGLKEINITFENNGDLGTYIDEGSSHRININLTKITSVSELVSTLSHELTHAVDSAINKSNGKATALGFGLEDNISNNISNTSLSLDSEEYKTLKEINMYCYIINPNERSARYGEISAIKFMNSLADTEKSKQQLTETVSSFMTYQQQTLDILNNLKNQEFFAGLQARVDKILQSSSLTQKDKEMFKERMVYIKEIMKGQASFENSMEKKSLEEIQKIADLQEMEQEIGMQQ